MVLVERTSEKLAIGTKNVGHPPQVIYTLNPSAFIRVMSHVRGR